MGATRSGRGASALISRWRRGLRHAVPAALLAGMGILTAGPSIAQPLTNTATGRSGGVALVDTTAVVRLTRVGAVAQSVTAEVSPNEVLTNAIGAPFVYDLLPVFNAGDAGISEIRILPTGGFSNVIVTRVEVDGITQRTSTRTTWDGARGGGVVTLASRITSSGTPIRIHFTADAPATGGVGGFSSEVADGALSMLATPGDADGDPTDANTTNVVVLEPQGMVLRLAKEADRRNVLVGDVVTYRIRMENTTNQDVVRVLLDDALPPAFAYRKGSARLNGVPVPDPVGVDVRRFDIGTVPARSDVNGNGTLEPGEPGLSVLSYQLTVGANARLGTHTNTAVAIDYCDTCTVSNEAEADVRLSLDPDFDLSTLIGKVFDDSDGDGRQDPGEAGVSGAMVVLDDGTYVLTDAHGRYHVPAVRPGQRAVKLNTASLPGGGTPTTDVTQVVWISPGLIARANFGVRTEQAIERIGQDADYGVRVAGEASLLPVHVTGNVHGPVLLLNGSRVPLPRIGVELEGAGDGQSIEFVGTRPIRTVTFRLTVPEAPLREWTFQILHMDGRVARTLQGAGPAPADVVWDGLDDAGDTIPGGIAYEYRLSATYEDGTEVESARRRFGVDQRTIVSLDLTGEAFETGSDALSAAAKAVLDEAVDVLREHPDERITIEGHTDATGSPEANLSLSERRARAAADYLIHTHGLPESQFELLAYGETRPVASNDIPEGRALNRRVQVHGRAEDVDTVYITDQYRVEPSVVINGDPVPVSEEGRFRLDVGTETDSLVVDLLASDGRRVQRALRIPEVTFSGLGGERRVAYGDEVDGWVAFPKADVAPGQPVVEGRIVGRTAPGTRITLGDTHRVAGEDSTFVLPFALPVGREALGFLVSDPAGGSRLINALIEVADHEADGSPVAVQSGTPYAAVVLPSEGSVIRSGSIGVTGETAPGNLVHVNGVPVDVTAQGLFSTVEELAPGPQELVVTVSNEAGDEGELRRAFTVAPEGMFLLAFVDAAAGQLTASGNLDVAGQEEKHEFYTEGRVAFYLKGRVSGKVLMTAALDTGSDEFEALFEDFDEDDTERLLANLDPETLYPVYGDGSRVVYDAESQGKLYLALDANTWHVLVGNHALSLTDTELAPFTRTLYGARAEYESEAETRYGSPKTNAVVFGSHIGQTHVRDRLRATGGSLYYLSHRDVIEGSERISIVVRDKHTGLTLSETEQIQNRDYDVKYGEGRVLFRRPIASVAADGSLVDPTPLSGHPVYVRVDYETRTDAFDETTSGGRVRQQLGDHLALGATVVDDHPDEGAYTLRGVDGEVRLAAGTRIVGEYVETEGDDATVFVSEDGGLTFAAGAIDEGRSGLAWKVAAETDAGEWMGKPGSLWIKGYVKKLSSGFVSAGNVLEEGTLKRGARASWVGGAHRFDARVDHEERTDVAAAGGTVTGLLVSGQWSYIRERWGASAEALSRDVEALDGSTATSAFAAARLWVTPLERVTARLEHQQTLDGPDNDQSTLGAEFRLHRSLALDAEATTGSLGNAARGGAVWSLGGSRLYLREELRDTEADRSRATILGTETNVGSGSRVYTEYQWVRSADRDRTISLLGAQRQWDVSKDLRLALQGETSTISTDSIDVTRTAFAGGASVHRPFVTARTRHEVRLDDGTVDRIQYVTANFVDVRLSDDVSLLGRYRYSRTRDRTTNRVDAELEERSVGIAYRPVRHDDVNGLARYTRRKDLRPGDDPILGGVTRTMDVASAKGAVSVTPRLELWSKGAARIVDEAGGGSLAYRTHTFLGIQRVNVNPWRRLHVGLEYRLLRQREAGDTRSGWLSELSWRFGRHLRAGGGYNFTSFSDDEFRMHDADVHGWFVRMQGLY